MELSFFAAYLKNSLEYRVFSLIYLRFGCLNYNQNKRKKKKSNQSQREKSIHPIPVREIHRFRKKKKIVSNRDFFFEHPSHL